MILIIHFMDGNHTEHDFSNSNENLHSWRVAEKTLIISKASPSPLGTRIEYPLINIRAIDINTD